jgi:hypothetical protein
LLLRWAQGALNSCDVRVELAAAGLEPLLALGEVCDAALQLLRGGSELSLAVVES